jgi:hypothetical protein
VQPNRAFLPLLLASSLASAAPDRWVEVAAGDNVTVFLDTQSIRRTGSKVKVWLRWVHEKPREVKGSFPVKTFLSSKSLEVYNCAERTAATLQSIKYAEAGGGEVVESLTGSDTPNQYSELAPETIGEGVLEFVCKPQRQPTK